jgi:hypothetical protein
MATFPTTTEITTAESSTYNSGTDIATGYYFANTEDPSPVGKIRGFLKAFIDLINFVKDTLNYNVNQRCILKNTTPFGVANNSFITVAFGSGTELYNPLSTAMHSTSSNNSRVIMPTAGTYRISVYIRFVDNTGGGARGFQIIKNGSAYPSPGINIFQNKDGIVGRATVSGVFYENFIASDYVELQVFHDAGGTIDCQGAYLSVEKVDI